MTTSETIYTEAPVHDGKVHPHIVSPALLLGVYGLLVLATIATVAVTMVNFGPFNIWVALAIAVVKAALVILYFMHLRWDSIFNGIILISALAFVMVFIGVALMDTTEYKMNNQPPGTRMMMSSQNGI